MQLFRTHLQLGTITLNKIPILQEFMKRNDEISFVTKLHRNADTNFMMFTIAYYKQKWS